MRYRPPRKKEWITRREMTFILLVLIIIFALFERFY